MKTLHDSHALREEEMKLMIRLVELPTIIALFCTPKLNYSVIKRHVINSIDMLFQPFLIESGQFCK